VNDDIIFVQEQKIYLKNIYVFLFSLPRRASVVSIKTMKNLIFLYTTCELVTTCSLQ
jgi:hypothetical protein